MNNLSLNIQAVTRTPGGTISGVSVKDKTYGVFTIPATTENGTAFQKLVGFCGPDGVFIWVHKNYRKGL